MNNFVLDEVLKPVARRIGTAIGASLSTLGLTYDAAPAIELVLVILFGLAFDLVVSHRNRKGKK